MEFDLTFDSAPFSTDGFDGNLCSSPALASTLVPYTPVTGIGATTTTTTTTLTSLSPRLNTEVVAQTRTPIASRPEDNGIFQLSHITSSLATTITHSPMANVALNNKISVVEKVGAHDEDPSAASSSLSPVPARSSLSCVFSPIDPSGLISPSPNLGTPANLIKSTSLSRMGTLGGGGFNSQHSATSRLTSSFFTREKFEGAIADPREFLQKIAMQKEQAVQRQNQIEALRDAIAEAKAQIKSVKDLAEEKRNCVLDLEAEAASHRAKLRKLAKTRVELNNTRNQLYEKVRTLEDEVAKIGGQGRGEGGNGDDGKNDKNAMATDTKSLKLTVCSAHESKVATITAGVRPALLNRRRKEASTYMAPLDAAHVIGMMRAYDHPLTRKNVDLPTMDLLTRIVNEDGSPAPHETRRSQKQPSAFESVVKAVVIDLLTGSNDKDRDTGGVNDNNINNNLDSRTSIRCNAGHEEEKEEETRAHACENEFDALKPPRLPLALIENFLPSLNSSCDRGGLAESNCRNDRTITMKQAVSVLETFVTECREQMSNISKMKKLMSRKRRRNGGGQKTFQQQQHSLTVGSKNAAGAEERTAEENERILEQILSRLG